MINAGVELDWTDLIDEINGEFDFVVPDEMIGKLDGTFDSLIRCIAKIKDRNERLPENGA